MVDRGDRTIKDSSELFENNFWQIIYSIFNFSRNEKNDRDRGERNQRGERPSINDRFNKNRNDRGNDNKNNNWNNKDGKYFILPIV